MKFLRLITNLLASLRMTLWVLGIMLMLMLAGAFIMPGEQAFQRLHSIPLFEWILKQPPGITWWLWGLIGVMAILAVNTLFCSIESIIKKRKVTQWLLLISPQVIHAGFLFMLLAHLLSSAGASQSQAQAVEGTKIRIAEDNVLRVRDINISLDYYGYITDWKVAVEYLSNGKVYQEDIIRPNDPSVHQGTNINVKDLRAYPVQMVLLQINREPGAVWALAGGILFMLGITTLIILKIKMEK